MNGMNAMNDENEFRNFYLWNDRLFESIMKMYVEMDIGSNKDRFSIEILWKYFCALLNFPLFSIIDSPENESVDCNKA